MTGKKNGNKLASTLKNEHDTITEIVKTVLTESDVLKNFWKETLKTKI